MGVPPALDRGLVELLLAERSQIVPFLGAGVAIGAGVPAAPGLARLLLTAAEAEGLQLGDVSAGDLEDVSTAIERTAGIEFAQQLTASVVNACTVSPTAVLRAVCRCPSGIILTTNYDDSIELTARACGLTPKPQLVDQAAALGRPAPKTVHVVHLHGRAAEPSSIVLPGTPTRALNASDTFKTLIRATCAPRTVVYFGFRLGVAETHLRSELDWLAALLEDSGRHIFVLPAEEIEARGDELATLRRNPLVEIFPYEPGEDHLAVVHAALLLAPANAALPRHVVERAENPSPYFVEPEVVLRTSDDRELPEALRDGADDIEAPLRAHLAYVEAEPGMGKTQLLLAIGERTGDRKALFARLPDLAGVLGDAESGVTSFLRFIARARGFDDATPVPTRAAVDSAAYALLLDGLDEVPAGRRAAVLEAVGEFVAKWPHHAVVIATRPVAESSVLDDLGFRSYELRLRDDWGRRYFETRSLPEGSYEEVIARAPTMAELVSIPLYAALLCDRLARAEALPATRLELLLGLADEAAEREARALGQDAHEFKDWLRDLATGMELLGRATADAGELAEINGRGELESRRLRERLVQASLLRDAPSVVAFPHKALQEAMCASRILGTADPAAWLARLAFIDVGGDVIARDDLDSMLSLLFEGAPSSVRQRLRALDERRFALTAGVSSEQEVDEALALIWSWHSDRRLWLGDPRSRYAGGPRAVRAQLRVLLGAYPKVTRRWIDRLQERPGDPVTAANRIEFLSAADSMTDDAHVIRDLADFDPIVRRAVSEAVSASSDVDIMGSLLARLRAEAQALQEAREVDRRFGFRPRGPDAADIVDIVEEVFEFGTGFDRLTALALVSEHDLAPPSAVLHLIRRLSQADLRQLQLNPEWTRATEHAHASTARKGQADAAPERAPAATNEIVSRLGAGATMSDDDLRGLAALDVWPTDLVSVLADQISSLARQNVSRGLAHAVVRELIRRGHGALVKRMLERDMSPLIHDSVRRDLAEGGDAGSQVMLLEFLTGRVHDPLYACPVSLGWTPRLDDDEVATALGELVGALLRREPRRSRARRQNVGAATSPLLSGIVRELATTEWPGGAVKVCDVANANVAAHSAVAWIYYVRLRVARRVATREILSRLPGTPAAVVRLLAEDHEPRDEAGRSHDRALT